jgi:hypothetical protein
MISYDYKQTEMRSLLCKIFNEMFLKLQILHQHLAVFSLKLLTHAAISDQSVRLEAKQQYIV